MIKTLQIGLSWLPESMGGLQRVYYELVQRLPYVSVDTVGLVVGSKEVARDSNGRVRALSSSGAALSATRPKASTSRPGMRRSSPIADTATFARPWTTRLLP